MTQSKEPYLTPGNENIPFADYIDKSRQHIEQNRIDLSDDRKRDLILAANCPYELIPPDPQKRPYRYGALLIHGLLDSPFSLRDIGKRLQSHGVYSRAILLPGHGTHPNGLLHVQYQEWLEAVRYGIASFNGLVEKLYLIGYSTGASLSLYHSLENAQAIAGLILLSPAIKIKAPIKVVVTWHKFLNWLTRSPSDWLYAEAETDYAKYRSISFNAVRQVAELTSAVASMSEKKKLETQMMMVLSHEDDTISSPRALAYFAGLENPANQLLLYGKEPYSTEDPRILCRPTEYPDLNISQFSHVSLPFTPENEHYGQHGDFVYASHLDANIYGPYNRIESRAGDIMYNLGLLRRRRRELTYNPDFNFMMEKISQFILKPDTKP